MLLAGVIDGDAAIVGVIVLAVFLVGVFFDGDDAAAAGGGTGRRRK